MSNNTNDAQNQPPKQEIGTAYIVENGLFRIVPLYDYSELKIVDEILNKNKKKKAENQEKINLNKFLQPKKVIKFH